MSKPLAPRENDLGRIHHPDPLRVGGTERTLIVDPMVDRLQLGDPLLGWSGDERLGLYVNVPARRFELWRYEHDHQLRMVATHDVDTVSVIDLVPKLIVRLIEHDTRRGFRPVEHVNAVNAAVEREIDRQYEARTEEFADRLRHALVKDGVD